MRKVVIIVLLCQLCISKSVVNLKGNNVTHTRKKAAGFLLSMPKTLLSGENETVCVSFHEARLPAKILIDLKWREKHHTTLRNIDSDSTCFEIQVPLKKIMEPNFISVRVQVQINGEVYSAHNQDPILMYPSKQNRVFVETDRGIYKPGDNVKFIIVQLNKKFLPGSRKITDVKIKNPMGITVKAWENLTPDHGLISLDYQMVSEAITGKWKLQVENQTKIFEVAKYSIPRFKIDIKYPKLIYYKTDAVNILVCGRYSYNKPVAGLAFIKISDSLNSIESINKLSEMKNGCSEFRIDPKELNLDQIEQKDNDSKIYILITSTVTESGTNKMEVATGTSKIVLKGYNLKFHSNPMFIPGVPYQGHLKLTNVISNYEKDVIEICYNLAIKKSWNYLNNEQCQNYTIENNGVIGFKLWPLKNSVLHVHLHARSLNNSLITDNYLLVRLFSPSSSYIQLEKQKFEDQTCNTHYNYKVSYSSDYFHNSDNVTFLYTVKSSTQILQMGKHVHAVRKIPENTLKTETTFLGRVHKYVKPGASTDHFNLGFEINKKFISRYQLLVYYVSKDGEIVAATKSEEIVPCSMKINSSWSRSQSLPGTMATLNIESDSPALCAVSATDKRSKFMPANQHNASLERILKVFAPDRESARSGRNGCILNSKKTQGISMVHNLEIDANPSLNLTRKKRHVYSFSEDYDAYDIFSRFGIVTITNLQVVTKPCYSGPLVDDSDQVQFLTDHYETAQEESSQVTIRSFFPENWLWELVPVANSVQLQREVPHSITNWVTNVFCVSETEGIGFSGETELTVFQPFFVEVLSPYSIKKGESFSLPVHVFNYVNYNFPIKMSIRMSDNLQLSHPMSATYCLKPNSTETHNYVVTGREIGTANVTILVESESQYPDPCGPETVVSKRDVVFKSFKIEPEGHLISNTKSALLCASSEDFYNNVTWNLSVPHNIVEGTNKVIVSMNADLLGHTIENLHHLLMIPSGCGEQIMASMAPNIYVLRYLTATGGLTSSIKQRVIRNLKMGYQRILNYAHRDGSFSAFGYYDPSGSMFLTAFVVRVLQEAKEFIYVDQRIVDKAVNWIFSHQLENGCFDTMYHVFQDMGGTNMENSTAGLTAYVIISLFDAKVNVPDTVQTNSKFCIRSQSNPDKYSLVISSYALFKVHWVNEAERFLEKAIAVANIENGLMWWTAQGNDDSFASDIEITSYALLAIMATRTAQNMAHAHSIVQWLASKMGPTGGFKSTQDTIVAMDALTKYAQYVQRSSLDLSINLEAHQENHIFAIKEDDRLKSKEVTLQDQDGVVKVFLTGNGCALTQLTTSYYSTTTSESEAFKLAVEVSPVSNIDQCSIKSISPCISYKVPDKFSNMVVMEMALPSGFSADRSSLYELIEPGNDKNIKKFEEQEDQINFYFTNLGKNQVCFSFNIRQDLPIENRKESLVKLYDYYRPEQNLLQFYRIINNCSANTIDGLQENVQSDFKPEAYVYQSKLAEDSLMIPNEEDLQNLPSSERNGHMEVDKCLYLGKIQTEEDDLLTYKRDLNQEESNLLSNNNQEMPKCIRVSLPKDRIKRETKSKKSEFRENPMLNKDFVNTAIEPQTPICTNIPFYTLYNTSARSRNKRNVKWLRYKRDMPSNLNKDFVDLDIDMEVPNCINIPFYAPIPAAQKNASNTDKSQYQGKLRH